MILTKILKDKALNQPDSQALAMHMGFRTVSLTYEEVYELSCKIALLLDKQEVKKGDRVLLLAPNSPYWVAVFWGCLLQGVVVIPLNVQSTAQFIERIAKRTQAKLFFAHRFYKQAAPLEIKRYDVELIEEVVKDFRVGDFREPIIKKDDLTIILYTSGTTGDPKGAMLSHQNLYANIESVLQIISFNPKKDKFLSILPLSHIFELTVGFLVPFLCGIPIYYAHSPTAIQVLMKDNKITKMLVVPEFLKILMAKIEGEFVKKGLKKVFNAFVALSQLVSKQWFSRVLFFPVLRKFGGRLDMIACGGAPLDVDLEKKWNALGITLLQGYGLTETSPLISTNTYKEHCFGSIGKVVPGVQVRIEHDEIQVKGDNVFAGYFNDEQKTKESFTLDGWFKTGDMGYYNENGFLFLKGRKKYMILGAGGQNVFPEDIELVLNSFDGVADSAVVGIEKPGGVVVIHAVLLLNDDIDVAAIIRKANEKLASYQQIADFSVWPEEDFPRSATKKVKKNEVLRVLEKLETKDEIIIEKDKSTLRMLLAELSGISTSRIYEKTQLIKDLHFDSLLRIELIARIENLYGILLDETKITAETTVADLENMIKAKEPIVGLPPLKRWPRSAVARFFRFLLQPVLFLLARFWMSIRVEGMEHLNKSTFPIVFMPNHVSYIDPLCIMMALPRNIRKKIAFAAATDVLYKDYKYAVPFAELLFCTFPFPRKEHENVKLGLDYMGKMLDEQYSVVVFPEGKMSEDGKLLPLKQGAGLVAVEMNTTVIPVYIEGSAHVLPYAKIFPLNKGIVTVRFGKPLHFKKSDSYTNVTEKIEKAMKKI